MTTGGFSSQTNVAAAVQRSQAKLSEISKFHPYNVLWAQLGDLYGSIGNPSKLSKTIVCGTQSTTVRKVLNILTYFIRCGEIKRINSTKIIEQDVIDDAINISPSKPTNKCEIEPSTAANDAKPKGMSRTKTFVKDLTAVDDSRGCTVNARKNDIPNVLAFRDSRFVQQELRIGNFQMDTGIDMNPEQKLNIQNYKIKDSTLSNPKIKLLITSPENDRYECEAAAEAIDFVLKKVDDDEELTLGELITANGVGGENCNSSKTSKLLWDIEPVKEGIYVEQWPRFSQKNTNIPKTDTDIATVNRSASTELKRSKSLNNKVNATMRRMILQNASRTIDAVRPPLARYASLADLITANSVGASNRLQWVIEPVKEIICHEEELYFQMAQKRIDDEHNLRPSPIGKSCSVVFVLGDNEVLSGLKSTSPSLVPPPEMINDVNFVTNQIEGISINTKESAAKLNEVPLGRSEDVTSTSNASGSGTAELPRKKTKKLCTHKKHSGVKFNFEQYPQIVTNYMKNKNLDIDSYDFLEKGLKLEQENALHSGATSTANMLPMTAPEEIDDEEEEEEQCECCASSSRVLQTPSNATELEFSNEDNSYPVPSVKTKSIDTISIASKVSDEVEATTVKPVTNDHSIQNSDKNAMDIIRLPIPKTRMTTDKNRNAQHKIGPGFVPSLFIGITDHYIADMVLQVRLSRTTRFNFEIHILFPFFFSTFRSGNHCNAIDVGANTEATSGSRRSLCGIRTNANRKYCDHCKCR